MSVLPFPYSMIQRIRLSLIFLLGLSFFLTGQPLSLSAQKAGYVQVNGKVRQNNKPQGGVVITITVPGMPAQTVTSKDNGSYVFTLDLHKSYKISFEKPGLVTKSVEFNTTVPSDQNDIIFQPTFDIDLFEDVAGMSQNAAMTKPVAKISYNPTYEDFVHDASYTKQIQTEQDLARKQAEELRRQQERARLDSLNKVWTDSLASVKAKEAQLLAQKAEQERLRAAMEKARQDSLARVAAEGTARLLAETREKARQDSISRAEARLKAEADAREKTRQDSLAKAGAEQARLLAQAQAREKARQDSTMRAEAEKSRKDSLARIKAEADAKALAQAQLKAQEKARQDSLQRAEAAEQARKKAEADALIQAQADAERLRLKAEADAKARIKAQQDSVTRAEAAAQAREKAISDSISNAKAMAKAKEQERLDSIDRAKSAMKAREKFVSDSLATARAEQSRLEAQAKAKADADAKARDKARQDSLVQVELAENARKKAIADSLAKVEADAKAKADALARAQEEAEQKKKDEDAAKRAALWQEKNRQDSLARLEADRLRNEALAKAKADADAKLKADEERNRKLNEEKARQDSLATAHRIQDEKEEQERRAKALAEIEAKKQMLSQSNAHTDDKDKTPVKTAAVPKIRDSDYHEGITEETVAENNRTIYRTVVKISGSAVNYQKIVYAWGGIFFFKNESNITQSLFEQELKNAKDILNNK